MRKLTGIIFLGLLLLNCSPEPEEQIISSKKISEADLQLSEQALIRAVCDSILILLEAGQIDELHKKFGSADKIVFSPYSYIDSTAFQALTFDQIKDNPDTLIWGRQDGTGIEMRYTVADYFKKFLVEPKFSLAPHVSVNTSLAIGNSIDNSSNFLPDCEFAEYYFPGFDEKYGGMDWLSLKIFVKKNSGHYELRGLICSRWTI